MQAKRSPSSPQGAPKKRSAFGDITNVSWGSVQGGGRGRGASCLSVPGLGAWIEAGDVRTCGACRAQGTCKSG